MPDARGWAVSGQKRPGKVPCGAAEHLQGTAGDAGERPCAQGGASELLLSIFWVVQLGASWLVLGMKALQLLCFKGAFMLQAKLLDYTEYKAAYDVVMHACDRKGKEILAHLDPQHGTTEDLMAYAELEILAQHYLSSTKLSAAQDHAIVLHLYATTGRGDEARSLRLADLLPPRPLDPIGQPHIFSKSYRSCTGKGLM